LAGVTGVLMATSSRAMAESNRSAFRAISKKHLYRGMPDNLHDGLSIDAGIC